MTNNPNVIPDSDYLLSLPTWAQKIWQVVAYAERNLAFRCDVFGAKTTKWKRQLIRDAQRNINADDAFRWEDCL